MELESYRIRQTDKAEDAVVETETDSRKRGPSKWEYLVPALAVVSLILACIIVSPKRYFWNDELYTYYFTSDPSFIGMLAAFHDKINNTPLLYFLLGWIWDKGFGSSELSLRLFSSLGICVALVVTWVTLRRSFSFQATAIGILGVFCTSRIMLVQNHEARMYGLFLALCALALWLYDQINRSDHPSKRLLLLNTLVHVGIVHTHLFGGFYSGAVLVAFMFFDWYRKCLRPKVYLSVALSWVTILFYLPSFFIQADAGKPRTWVPTPVKGDLIGLMNVSNPPFFQPDILVFLLVLTAILYFRTPKRNVPLEAEETRETFKSELSLVCFATLFVLMPVFVWVVSRTIKPIFLDRYMLPSALGWMILLSYIASRMTYDRGFFRLAIPYFRKTASLSLVAFVGALGVLLYHPLSYARNFPKQSPPFVFATEGYEELPVVITNSHPFLQAQHYSPHRDKYYYILDWESAVDRHSGLFTPQEYKHLDAINRNYPERFEGQILSSEEFLSRHERFLVADYPNYTQKCPPKPKGMKEAYTWENMHCPQWVELRLLNNKDYKVTYLNNSHWYAMLLVEKVKK